MLYIQRGQRIDAAICVTQTPSVFRITTDAITAAVTGITKVTAELAGGKVGDLYSPE
ncbi:hypothetical protein PoB_005390200, partial [Plakobranchus ocellatus]